MSMNNAWEGAAGSPFYPVISKERQFLVGFSLLLVGQSSTTHIRFIIQLMIQLSLRPYGAFRIE